MSDYQFTRDWFHWAPDIWTHLTPMLPDRKAFLEIGSFEGRSAAWIVENMAEDGATILCIDTWQGAEEHKAGGEDMQAAERRFDHNAGMLTVAYPLRHIRKVKDTSYRALAALVNTWQMDFIYIDGSHKAKDVLADACMAWPLLKTGGIMVFDDYSWGDPRDVLHRPKIAVDAFVNIYAEEIKPIHTGYQLAIQKI